VRQHTEHILTKGDDQFLAAISSGSDISQQWRSGDTGQKFFPPVAIGRNSQSTAKESIMMNWDRIEGNWKQLKGNVKQQWGKLTDDQIDVIAGKRDKLAGKIQESYGISKDEAEKQLAAWQDRQEEK
jgi:uncharacterized protein YjbJ (UPF0337 family)